MTPSDLVALAVQVTGPMGDSEQEWRTTVTSMIAMLGEMAREPEDGERPSEQYQLAHTLISPSTIKFVTHYGGYELEASSKRLIVSFLDADGKPELNTKGKPETIRTEPMWGGGQRVRAILDGMEIGDRMLVYKVEQRKDADTKVRVMPHCTPLGKPVGAASRPARQANGSTPDVVPFDYDGWRAALKQRLGDYRYHLLGKELEQKNDIPLEAVCDPATMATVKDAAKRIFETEPEEEPF